MYQNMELELRKVKSIINDEEYYEIVQWYPNDLYGKQNEYIRLDDGRYKHPNFNFYCHEESFKKEKYCYTVCYFKYDSYEGDIECILVGDRILNEEVDWIKLKELMKEGFEKARKLYNE